MPMYSSRPDLDWLLLVAAWLIELVGLLHLSLVWLQLDDLGPGFSRP